MYPFVEFVIEAEMVDALTVCILIDDAFIVEDDMVVPDKLVILALSKKL